MYRKKNLIIISMCVIILFMVVGYAVFSTNLKINGTANIESTWDIYFESITTTSIVGNASNVVEPTVSALTATINYEIDVPGDKLVYEIVLKNNGTLNAVVEEINVDKGGAPQIIYTIEGIQKGDKISAGSKRTITLTIEFDSSVTSNPALKETLLKIDLTCVQDTGSTTTEDLVVYQPMLKKSVTTTGSSVAFLEGPITKEEVETVTFTNSKTVPSGVKGSWDVSANDDFSVMAWYFDSDSDNLYEVYIGQDGGVLSNPTSSNLFSYLTEMTSIDLTYFDTSNATTMKNMFYQCESLTELDLSKFDTSKVTDMSRMFGYCKTLTTLDLSSFDTSNVTTMENMFYESTKLQEINLSNFDTGNVTNMLCMFYNCTSLTKLDLSSFDTSRVTTMRAIFYDCRKLQEINLSSFDTSNVTDMKAMFGYCMALTSLDVSNFDTSKVTIMAKMFDNCVFLKTLDLSSFDTTKVTDTEQMFYGNYNLKTIYVSSLWTMANVTNSTNMFSGCEKITGENGTKLDSNYIDKTYARIDGGTSSPGYLTLKSN